MIEAILVVGLVIGLLYYLVSKNILKVEPGSKL
jgi:hypothetical protein